jgi:arsenate reductase
LATLFRENGIDFDKVNYFNEAFTPDRLKALAKKAGIRPIEMTRGAAAAGLTKDTPDADVIAAMAADPNLIQRPIVEVGSRAVVARPIDKALVLIESAK